MSNSKVDLIVYIEDRISNLKSQLEQAQKGNFFDKDLNGKGYEQNKISSLLVTMDLKYRIDECEKLLEHLKVI